MAPWFAAIILLLITGNTLADEFRFVLLNGTDDPISELTFSPSQINARGANVLRPPAIKPVEVDVRAILAVWF
jgi:hypothetical protein